MSVSIEQEHGRKPEPGSLGQRPRLWCFGPRALSAALLGLLLGVPACAKDEASSPAQAQRASPASSDQTSSEEPDPFPASSDDRYRDDDEANAAPVEEVLEDATVTPGGGVSDSDESVSAEPRPLKRRKKASPKHKAGGTSSKPDLSPEAGERDQPGRTRPATTPEPSIADPESLIASLSSLEGQLRSAGVRLPQDTRADSGEGREDDKKVLDCEKVCELRVTICSLEEHICALAKSHPEDDRYTNACRRARGDCRVASAACASCE